MIIKPRKSPRSRPNSQSSQHSQQSQVDSQQNSDFQNSLTLFDQDNSTQSMEEDDQPDFNSEVTKKRSRSQTDSKQEAASPKRIRTEKESEVQPEVQPEVDNEKPEVNVGIWRMSNENWSHVPAGLRPGYTCTDLSRDIIKMKT